MLKIQPQYLPLIKLLNDRLFLIPEYQRAYSWKTQQRKDLFEDLRKIHEKGDKETHFMAAIVCLRKGIQKIGTDELQVMHIVDGQQRLTTLILLLKQLSLILGPKNKKEKKLADELQELLVKPDGDELLLLQTNHDSSHYFSDFIRYGKTTASSKAKTASDREILLAIEECARFVDNWAKHSSLIDLGALLKNKLYFLLHEIDDEKSVYTVFEVLNSRGLPVSWFDRLKSILMGIAYELPSANSKGLIENLRNTWRDIYHVVGLRQGLSTEALRFAATLYTDQSISKVLGEEDSVNTFKEFASEGAAEINKISTWLLDVAEACDEVIKNKRTNAVTRISHTRLLAVAINLHEDLDRQDKEEVLSAWEKVTFRIFGMLGKDSRTRVGDYTRLARKITKENLSKDAIIKEIEDIGEEFSIGDAVNSLKKANCYEGWQEEFRYFMFRYEEHLADQQGMKYSNKHWNKIWAADSTDSIEHIYPQSKASDEIKHRLGNLVMLPPKLNSKLGNISPKDKIDAYKKTGLLINQRVAEIIETKGRWGKTEINLWEKELLEWASHEWE